MDELHAYMWAQQQERLRELRPAEPAFNRPREVPADRTRQQPVTDVRPALNAYGGHNPVAGRDEDDEEPDWVPADEDDVPLPMGSFPQQGEDPGHPESKEARAIRQGRFWDGDGTYPVIKKACAQVVGGHRVPVRVSERLKKGADVKLAQRIWLGIGREGGAIRVLHTKGVAKTSPGRFSPVVDTLVAMDACRCDGHWLWINKTP